MEKTISFTHMEKEFLPGFREGVNNAKNAPDLENFFAHAMASFLQRIMGESFHTRDSDVLFAPGADPQFVLHPRLLQNPLFHNLHSHSDLPRILRRFASSLDRRYQHVIKHTSRTRLKIRN